MTEALADQRRPFLAGNDPGRVGQRPGVQVLAGGGFAGEQRLEFLPKRGILPAGTPKEGRPLLSGKWRRGLVEIPDLFPALRRHRHHPDSTPDTAMRVPAASRYVRFAVKRPGLC